MSLKISLIASLAFLMLAPLHIQADSDKHVFNSQISVTGEAAKYLEGIEIKNADNSLPDYETTVEIKTDSLIRLYLGLGDPIAKLVKLRPRIGESKFKVEQRYETSLTLMDEGPHLDLMDWKHYISDWEEVQSENGLVFFSKHFSGSEFPKVSQAQIVEAVRAKFEKWANQGIDGGDRWIALAKKCKGPNEYPCGVSVSRVMLRILVQDSGKFKNILNIELRIPMGC